MDTQTTMLNNHTKFIFTLWLILSLFCFGQDNDILNDAGNMDVSADRMEMRYGEYIELTGNVIVSDESKMLTADKMIITLDDSNHPIKVEANGQVFIRQLDTNDSAAGDHGIYDIESKTVMLEGACTIIHEDKNGKHIMSCPSVVYDCNTRNFITQKSQDGERPKITLPGKANSGDQNFQFPMQ